MNSLIGFRRSEKLIKTASRLLLALTFASHQIDAAWENPYDQGAYDPYCFDEMWSCDPCQPSSNEMSFGVFGEYHLFTPRQEGISFAKCVDLEFEVPTIDLLDNYRLTQASTVKEHQFSDKWDSGFLVGLTWKPACSGIRLSLGWDWMHSRRAETLESSLLLTAAGSDMDAGVNGVGQLIIPTWGQSISLPFFSTFLVTTGAPPEPTTLSNSIDATWSLDVNQVDLVLDYHWSCGSCISITPYFGLRGVVINQSIRSDFTYGIGFKDLETTFLLNSYNRTHYRGLGPLIGLGLDWEVACGLGLYGYGKGALLLGSSSFSQKTSMEGAGLEAEMFIEDLDTFKCYDEHVTRGMTELGAGISYENSFGPCKDKFLRLWAGWQHRIYYSQNFFVNSLVPLVSMQDQPIHYSGNLSFWGFVAGASFSF